MSSLDLSILIPVYNEVDNIAQLLEILKRSLPGVRKEIIVVDDGSNDGTREWLTKSFGTVFPENKIEAVTGLAFGDGATIKIIFHEANKGKGGAIRTAMRASKGAVLVTQDADFEYDPADWLPMYDLIARRKLADVVYGSRFYGRPHRCLYYHHYMANRLISIMFNLMYNQALTDIECGYKMFTREVFDTLNITAEDFGFEVQISAQIALRREWRIYELGIHYYGRTYEEGKKITWKDGIKALWYLFKFRISPGN